MKLLFNDIIVQIGQCMNLKTDKPGIWAYGHADEPRTGDAANYGPFFRLDSDGFLSAKEVGTDFVTFTSEDGEKQFLNICVQSIVNTAKMAMLKKLEDNYYDANQRKDECLDFLGALEIKESIADRVERISRFGNSVE